MSSATGGFLLGFGWDGWQHHDELSSVLLGLVDLGRERDVGIFERHLQVIALHGSSEPCSSHLVVGRVKEFLDTQGK